MTDQELYYEIASAEDWSDKPFTDAIELADRIGMTRQGVRQRLETLVEERDDVNRYKPSRDVIYWVD